jgi:allene oxide cyclase
MPSGQIFDEGNDVKIRHLSATILLAAGVLAGCGDDEEGARTVHVIEHATTNTLRHIGPVGEKDSLGDVLAYANPIFDAADQKRIGMDNGSCIRTVVGKAWECTWTTLLPDGQIVVEGPFYDDRDSVNAITGGTGAYADATGEMDLRYRDPKGTEYDFIFHLQGED